MLSKIAIGTAQFGMSYGISNKTGEIEQNEINAILGLAKKNQIKTLDTAQSYGSSEKKIGNYLIKSNQKDWTVITKISDLNNSILDQIKLSQINLNLRPAIILAHSKNIYLDEKFQKFILNMEKQGNKYKIGVSLYNEQEINEVMKFGMKPDIVQLPLNILDTRLYKRGILSKLYENKVEIHARSIFLQGLFYLSESRLKKQFNDVLPYMNKLNEIAEKYGISIASLSLLWTYKLKEVTKIIIGIDTLSQLQSHINTLSLKIKSEIFEQALKINYENEKILNPTLWEINKN